MTWTLCTSGAAMLKAGLTETEVLNNLSGADLITFNDEAESIVCAIARNDLVTAYSGLTANGKQLINSLCSNLMAQKIALNNKVEYSSNREFETVLDIIENDIRKYTNLIEEDKIKTYLGAT